MVGLFLLLSIRLISTNFSFRWFALFATLNLIYLTSLIVHAIPYKGIDRSNYSFFLVVLTIYIAPSCLANTTIDNFKDFEKWFINALKIFLFTYTFLSVISNTFFLRFSPPSGLITPQLAAAIFLGFKNRNKLLLLLAVTSFIGISKNHYQTSYFLAPLSVLIVLYGAKYKILRVVTLSVLILYSISIVFTDLLIWMLSVSKSEGYDNVNIRVSFVEYGLNFVKMHPVFGGALTYPVTILIKNAGVVTTLPLHSDGLTWLIGTGLIGWLLYSLTIITCINYCWANLNGNLINSVSAVLLCNYLTGIFNSQYSTYSYMFACTYIAMLGLSISKSKLVNTS